MARRMYSLLVFLVLMFGGFYTCTESSGHTLFVYIDADNGEDSAECLQSNSTQHACQSLSFIAENLTQNEAVAIEIRSNLLNLTKPVEFRNYTGLTIIGAGPIACIHCNVSNAGLAFVLVRNLTLKLVAIKRCGALRESTSIDPDSPDETEYLSIALYLLNCTHVNIQYVDIQSSDGTGISVYDTNGVVDIKYSNVLDNRMESSTKGGGGGLHIEFTYCTPGVVGACLGHGGFNRGSTYTISNCVFSNNHAQSNHSGFQVIPRSPTEIIPRVGKGGGLYLSIGSTAVNNSITIINCTFNSNSVNLQGGGALFEFLNSVRNNMISVFGTSFENNTCPENSGRGGGINLGVMLYTLAQLNKTVPENNSFFCSECAFDNNSAQIGGGTVVVLTKGAGHGISTVQFERCNWTCNSSPLGAAVFISPGIWDYPEDGVLPVPKFTDCTFESNIGFHIMKPMHNGMSETLLGCGALFLSKLRVLFSGNTRFCGNNGSAVYMSQSVMEFDSQSTATFDGNTGKNGGAIAMYSSSSIRLHNDSNFTFTGNTAYSTGGAIFSSTFLPQLSYSSCFIQPSVPEEPLISSYFYFSGNRAKRHSNASIYVTTFRPCAVFCKNQLNNTEPETILNCLGRFEFENTAGGNTSVVTAPTTFTINDNPVKIIPGSEHQLNITVLDEANNTLYGTVYEATALPTNVRVDPAFMQVSNNTISLQGEVGDHANLILDTSDISLSISIELMPCQPGYIHNNGRCECAATEYFGMVTCDPHVLLNHGIWMGYCSPNTTELCTGYCPYGFCSYHMIEPKSSLHPLPTDPKLLDYQICGPNRTGRVCSECVHGHSVYFHSWRYTCGRERLCDVGWVFYLLSEILPLTLCFIFIIVFNISFTNGNLNCFVLFAQILDALSTNANGLIEFPQFVVVIRGIQNFFYRTFNLDFFSMEELSFCLWKGATVIDALIMKYVTVGFALLLVLLTILVFRCCGRFKIFTKFYTPKSVLIHGFSAFFVLCYSQCARVTFQILNYFCLFSTNFHCEETVVYRVGYMDYLKEEHLKYAVIAIIVLVFIIVIPPLLLLIYPLMFRMLSLCKLSESKLVGILWRVMPIQLLDSFQSSFKDNFRFFAGLYFLNRAFVLGAYAYCRTMLQFYTVVQMQLILFLALHAIFQPYKKRKHNIIDSLLFTNLAIINGITLYNFAETKNGKGQDMSVRAVMVMSFIQTVLIFLPLLSIVVLGIERLVIKAKKWRKDRAALSDSQNFDSLPPLRDPEAEPLYQRW